MREDGMMAVAGATGSGRVYVFSRKHPGRHPTNWTLDSVLLEYNMGFGYSSAMFGTSVRINSKGDLIASGGPSLYFNGSTQGDV